MWTCARTWFPTYALQLAVFHGYGVLRVSLVLALDLRLWCVTATVLNGWRCCGYGVCAIVVVVVLLVVVVVIAYGHGTLGEI